MHRHTESIWIVRMHQSILTLKGKQGQIDWDSGDNIILIHLACLGN